MAADTVVSLEGRSTVVEWDAEAGVEVRVYGDQPPRHAIHALVMAARTAWESEARRNNLTWEQREAAWKHYATHMTP